MLASILQVELFLSPYKVEPDNFMRWTDINVVLQSFSQVYRADWTYQYQYKSGSTEVNDANNNKLCAS